MNKIDRDINDLPPLLRSLVIKLKENKYVLNEAAKLIEHLAEIRKLAKTIVKDDQ